MTGDVLTQDQEVPELTDEQKRARRRALAAAAVALATQSRWDDAERVNREILLLFPDDVEANNRLGKALLELKRYHEAIEAYEYALQCDPVNVIAQRNLARLRLISPEDLQRKQSQKLGSAFFIEEVGKTGVATLSDAAPPEIVARVSAGDEVELDTSAGTLRVQTIDGAYLGTVPPPLGQRLVRLIQGGNRYQAGVVMAEDGRVRILIRETYQSPDQAGRISFPPQNLGVRAYTRDSLLRRSEDDDSDLEEDMGDVEPDDMDDDDENPAEFGFSETTLSDDM